MSIPIPIEIDESTKSPFLIDAPKDETKNFIEITPLYSFTVKTSLPDVGDKELDINICTHEGISAPHMITKLDNDGKPIEGLNVPVSIGELKESNGHFFHNVVFNTSILDDIKDDTTGKYRGNYCSLLKQLNSI